MLHDIRDIERLARTALENGGVIEGTRKVRWDISSGCQNPVTVWHDGAVNRRPLPALPISVAGRFADEAAIHGKWRVENHDGLTKALLMDLITPCRQCPRCLALRAYRWRVRAETETNCAARTWFGTLTLSPEQHFKVRCQASLALPPGQDWEALSEAEQFLARHRVIGRELTLYIKRVRQDATGAGLRFISVAERHKSGLPHYHLLVHEAHGGAVVRHAALKAQWTWGFSKWSLVKRKRRAAYYVSKYIAKSALGRVRASVRYGNASTALSHSAAAAGLRETPCPPSRDPQGGEGTDLP